MALLSCLALLLCAAPELRASSPPPVRALILYDTGDPDPWIGELHAIQVANLLGHFPMAYDMKPVGSYSAGDIENYAVTFYLGDSYSVPLPDSFLSDVRATERTVCWFKYNLWQIAWDSTGYWDPSFTARYGFQFAGMDDSGFPEVQYKGESLTKDLQDPDIGATVILDPTLAEVKAVADRPATDTQPEVSWPYVVQSGNLWYWADAPFSYASEDDRYLVFCDLIHDIVGIDHAPSHQALIRIEDVSPASDPTDLTSVADYLASEKAPFEVATIPVFNDPLGAAGPPSEVFLSQSSGVKNALRHMVQSGGQIFAHGYTHQYDSTANPYDGMTGDDCEFFRSVWNATLNETELVGPLPEDSVDWVDGRIDQSIAELAASGFTPVAWETPHYTASALDSVEFGKNFNLTSGRVLYFTSDGSEYLGQFFPYVIERDIYGQRISPENLGDVELEAFYDYPPHLPADIVTAAQKNLVVRDGWASAYFHPDLDISYLKDIIDGVKGLGYTYTAVSTVIAEAGPDQTIIDGQSASLTGSASNGTTPYHYSWSPTTGLSNPSSSHPTASPDSTTLYTLTVTDAKGGTDRDTVSVIVIPKLVVDAGPGWTITPGDSVTLQGTATGGQPPYTYSWSPTAGLDNPAAAQPVASPGATTTYTLTVTDSGIQTESDTVTVTVVPHTLTVTASAAPSTVASEGSTTLSAAATDSGPHQIAFWSWSDGGAGGTFSPSADVQAPAYQAPANRTDNDEAVVLTVTATCNGPSPLTASGSTTLTVQPVAHVLTVTASASPGTVASGASASLSATATDSRTGHTIASWSWSDGGAGGVFAPSAKVQGPTYTPAANTTDGNRSITLTVTATCNGPTPATASGSTTLIVQPVAHVVVASASVTPGAIASGGTASLSATATDSHIGHIIASWSWSDGGAGGSFSPSAAVQNPSYTAPANRTDSDETITLTVAATCNGLVPASGIGSTTLTVHPVAHTFSVTAGTPDPATVPSSGISALSATASDSHNHGVASWSWTDGGAGGGFSPSASVQNPSYTAPVDRADTDEIIALVVTGTCSGPEPLHASDTTTLTVQPVPHTLSVAVSAAPTTVASGAAAHLSASAVDSRDRGIAAWAWSDSGAGGVFLPSAAVPSPLYLAPENLSGADLNIAIVAAATCDAPDAITGAASVTLIVESIPPGASEASAKPLPLSLTWDQSTDVSITYRNLDAFSWQPDRGYHLQAEAGMDRWGLVSLPLDADVSPGASYTFDFSAVAPPLTTLSYHPPVTSTAPGLVGALDCAWQFARGDVPWTGSLTSQEVVISRFSDIQPDLGDDASWARFHIEELAGRVPMVVNGFEDGTYRPGIAVARDAMAVYLLRALKLPTGPYQGLFTDVSSTDWAWAEIEGLARAGVVKGFDDGTYRPTSIVTRDAMAVYISRGLVGGLQVPEGPATPTFSDVPADYWAYNEIEYCAAHNIAQGFPDNTYRPEQSVDRSQMAVYVWRAFVAPAGTPVVLGGPAVTSVNPAAASYQGWSSRPSGSASAPGYAYVVFDAARFDPAMAAGDGSFDVRFELQGPVTCRGTSSLTDVDLATARDAARSSGVPYYAVAWEIPAGLPSGSYTLVVSVEHAPGVFQELPRQPGFTITP